jgi:hypothetical protein
LNPRPQHEFLGCFYAPKGAAMERKLCVKSENFITRIIKEVIIVAAIKTGVEASMTEDEIKDYIGRVIKELESK